MKEKKSNVVVCLCIVLGLALVLRLLGLLAEVVVDLEHYRRVYQNPLTVTATVTWHDEYEDSEGGTDYKSYITYTVDDVEYSNIHYETTGSEEKLTPLGTTIEVQVSPEDPADLLSELRDGAGLFLCLPIAGIIAGCWRMLAIRKRSKTGGSTPDRETIRQDALLTVRGRTAPVFFLLLCVIYSVLYLRYSMALGILALFAALVCAVCWLVYFILAIRDANNLKKDNFRLHRDVLINKWVSTNADNDDIYSLTYQSQGRTWKETVPRSSYEKAQIGDTVLAVYLPGKKKPIVYYNSHGEALAF